MKCRKVVHRKKPIVENRRRGRLDYVVRRSESCIEGSHAKLRRPDPERPAYAMPRNTMLKLVQSMMLKERYALLVSNNTRLKYRGGNIC